MAICTTPFEVTVRNIARVLGLPDYPVVKVEHPIGSCTLPELKERAQVAYQQAVDILLKE
ncbi:MAG: hypothetical protein JSR24_01740 [Proteobacteria bacterium]|nr:hypothetical protein [Pseudomonadota bacterium]